MFGTWFVRLTTLIVIASVTGCGNLGSARDRQLETVATTYHLPTSPAELLSVPPVISNEWDLQLAQVDRDRLVSRGSNWFGDVLVFPPHVDEKPTPIPGRVLIEIAPTELRTSFRPGGANCDPVPFIRKGLLPRDLEIESLRYHSLQTDRRINLRVILSAEMAADRLRESLDPLETQPTMPETASPEVGVLGFVVTIDPNRVKIPWRRVCESDFPYLKADSSLRAAFRKAGVLSMHRVLRSTEQPDRTRPGFYTTRSFKDMLAAAKSRFPRRSARAWPDIAVPDNLENIFLLQLDPASDLVAVIDDLGREGGAVRLSVDYPVVATTNDPEYPDQWALDNDGSFQAESPVTPDFDVNADVAWAAGSVTQPIVVAVLDTGFKEDLDELQNRLWTNATEIPGNGDDDDCNGYVDDVHGITTYDPLAIDYSALPACSVSPGREARAWGTHGTEMAGLIAAEADNNVGISGVAGTDPVQLMNITLGQLARYRVFTGTAEVAEGLAYALDKGAAVANMSFTVGGLSFVMHDAVQAALANGMVLVASAGNDATRFTKAQGYASFGAFPAGMVGVISVGGSQRDGLWYPESNYGPGLDFVAPASQIRTISHDPSNPSQTIADVVTVEGTSASAAITSGAVAVILGRYPAVTAPYMRQWLRATARDMLDPLGNGANLQLDDEWTGAGMLDLGNATVVLENPLDQPLNADLLVERLSRGPPRHFSNRAPDAVAGTPDLGVTVTGPNCVIGSSSQDVACAFANWRLDYGLGDAPLVWTPIAVPASVRTQPQEVARSGSAYYRHTEVASGINYLDTDNLQNNQLYTIRLTAENRSGRKFFSYDWVIPTRARVTNPSPQTTIHDRWGWMGLDGFTDIRDGATYVVSMADENGNPLWSTAPFAPSGRYDALLAAHPGNSYNQVLADGWGTSASAWMSKLAAESSTIPGWTAAYPTTAPADLDEGWVDLTLNVQTAVGATETDTRRLYLDRSHLPARTGWPVTTDHRITSSSYGDLQIADLGGAVGHRILATKLSQLRCLDSAGASHWNANSYLDPVIGDVDNDGTSEILTATTANFWPGMGNPGTGPPATLEVSLHLWAADSCADNGSTTGSPYGSNWPVTYSATSTDTDGWYHFGGIIDNPVIADITGDANKEIIFYHRPNHYYGIPVADITDGSLRVLNADGNEIWSRSYSPSVSTLPFEVADIDSDGKAEILLESEARILQGDNTFRPGWDAVEPLGQAVFLLRGSGMRDILLHSTNRYDDPMYRATLLSRDGAVRNGWPIGFSSNNVVDVLDSETLPAVMHVITGQILPGGNEEIVFCENKLSAVDRIAQPVMPDIDLNGSCQGLMFADVDADSEQEIVVLVRRMQQNVAPTARRGVYLEAYDFDGTRLADTDDRWPVVVSTVGAQVLHDDISVGDIDGDGSNEVVQQLQIRPYHGQMSGPNPRHMIELLETN